MLEMLKEIKIKRFVQVTVCLFGVLITLIPITGSLIRGDIDCDSAYYICQAQLCAKGFVPYIDFSDGYTPLWTYLAAGLKLLFNVPDGCYVFYLAIHYLLAICVALFIYKIAVLWGASRMVSFLGACMFMVMSHWLEGNVVLLEIPSLCFGMMSVWLTLSYQNKIYWNYVWIGILTACSFLCKQFGFGFLLLNLYLIVFVNRQTWKECLCLIAGFALPIVLCFVYWGEQFIPIVISGYGTESAAAVGYDVSFLVKMKSVLGTIWYFLYMVCPAIIVSLFFIPFAISHRQFGKMLFCYLGILGFALQYYFALGGFHYMLYMVPFAVLLMIVMMTMKSGKLLRLIGFGSVFLVILVSIYKTSYNRVYKLYINKNIREEQIAITKEVRPYLREGNMWVAHGGLNYLYLTTGMLPPNLSAIGYSFGPLGLDEEKAFTQTMSADFVIRFSADYPYEAYFTDSLKHYIERYQAVALQDSAILVHDMHKPLYTE